MGITTPRDTGARASLSILLMPPFNGPRCPFFSLGSKEMRVQDHSRLAMSFASFRYVIGSGIQAREEHFPMGNFISNSCGVGITKSLDARTKQRGVA